LRFKNCEKPSDEHNDRKQSGARGSGPGRLQLQGGASVRADDRYYVLIEFGMAEQGISACMLTLKYAR